MKRGKRRANKSSPKRGKDGRFVSRKRKPLKRKSPPKKSPPKKHGPKPTRKNSFRLCFVRDRRQLYDQILKDRQELRKELTDEEYSELRVEIDIDPVRKNARKPKRQKADAARGHRKFSSLRKLKNFLGLNAKYDDAPDWRKQGLCKYKKTGNISLPVTRGERVIRKKILKQYEFPFVDMPETGDDFEE